MNDAIRELRAEGNAYLRRARELDAPVRMGRPRKGEVRNTPHDRAFERAKCLRRARYAFTTAARVVRYPPASAQLDRVATRRTA